MMVGIVTLHASHNCGSMLQAFALQTVLEKKYGADVRIIDFANAGSRNTYGLIDWRPKKIAIRHNINTALHFPTMASVRREYMRFSDAFLKKSMEGYRNEQQLTGAEKKYDLLVAGGDQVWNVRIEDASTAFFLAFAKDVRKVAYSPSLGGSDIFKYASDIEAYRRYLRDFEKLSVREPNGQAWLQKLTGRPVPIVADPTLLLSADEWTEYLPVPEVTGEYIFNYAFYHNRPETNRAIQEISRKLKMPVYVMDHKSWALYKLSRYGIEKYPITGPLAFLGLMKNASLVLTQSFHGTLFSALFNRKFWSYVFQESRSDDDRATSVLEQLGLPERYQSIDDLSGMDIMAPIDYKHVNEKIVKLRTQAFSYIDSFMHKSSEEMKIS